MPQYFRPKIQKYISNQQIHGTTFGAQELYDANRKEISMLYTILLIILILALLGALPTWPYSAGWGYWPSGGLGLVVVIVLLLVLLGRL